MAPVELSTDSPEGSPVTDQVSPDAPLAASVAEYALPSVADGRDVVVMVADVVSGRITDFVTGDPLAGVAVT